jgi:type IV secretion system protein TrbL
VGATASILDGITGAFITALQAGFGVLQASSLLLLGAFALIAFCLHMAPLVAQGAPMGDGLAGTLWIVIRIGVFYWLILNTYPMALAGLETFVNWGLAPSGGVFTLQSFLQPSTVLESGLRAGWPLMQFVQNMSGWAVLFNLPILFVYSLAYLVIVGAFLLMAFGIIFTIVEFHLSVMVAAVLIPWGVLGQVAFFAEFSIAWVTGGVVRALLTAAMMGIAIPLFDQLVPVVTEPVNGDPTWYSAFVLAGTSGLFAYLGWTIPKKAALVGGRGMALGLGSTLSFTTGWGAVRTLVMHGAQAVRGAAQRPGSTA